MNRELVKSMKENIEALRCKYFMLVILNEETNYSEMIISQFEYLEEKLNYILSVYDEDMRLKNNKNIRILDICLANDLTAMEIAYKQVIKEIEVR